MSDEIAAETAGDDPPMGKTRLWIGLCAALLTVGAVAAAAWPWSAPARTAHAPSERIESVAAPVPPQHGASAPADMAAAALADAASAVQSGRAVTGAAQSTTLEEPMQRLLRRLNELAGVHVAADTGAPGELRLTTRAHANESGNGPAVR